MSEARLTSAKGLFRDPELFSAAQAAVRRAEAMGVIESKDLSGNPDPLKVIQRLRDRMNHLGIGQINLEAREGSVNERHSEAVSEDPEYQRLYEEHRDHEERLQVLADKTRLSEEEDLKDLRLLLNRMNEALEGSPIPNREWPRLVDLLGRHLLSELIDVSLPSIRRYQKGDRKTPDAVAARLHYLALLVGNLAGAYNEIGIRRWFERKRHQLSERSPLQVLGKEWSPEDEGPARVRQLAESLTTSPAT